jgi:hypothetical protein
MDRCIDDSRRTEEWKRRERDEKREEDRRERGCIQN